METIYSEDLVNLDLQKHVIIDLRTPFEIRHYGSIKNAINIPVDDLRNRLEELSPDKTYILYCAVGVRGYIAYRILSQLGYKAKNLSGGMALCGHCGDILV
jgi:rhodanese-related sulfurtransferase